MLARKQREQAAARAGGDRHQDRAARPGARGRRRSGTRDPRGPNGAGPKRQQRAPRQ
jgi:hypothetical protein